MNCFDFAFGDFTIEKFTDRSYLVTYYNDRREKVFERSINLETLCRMAKLLKAYAKNEKKWAEEGGAR